jgi:penicillin amidase
MDRITRIRQLLKSKEKLSIEDFKKIQQDVYSVLAAEMTPLLIQALDRPLDQEEARKARDTLSKWDFRMDKDSVGACLFEVTYRKMMENTFRDELGGELFTDYLETASFPPRAIRTMLRRGSSPWFDDVKTPGRETMEDILLRSLTQMLSELKDLLGGDMDKWTWGRIHSLTFTHVLAEKKPLDRIFNLGPFPLGGSQLTVNKGQFHMRNPTRQTWELPSG